MEAPRLGRKDRSQFWPKRQFPAAKAPTPARPAPAPRFASPWLLFALTAGMKGPKPPNTCCLWGLCCWGWACWGWGPPKPRNLVLGEGAGAAGDPPAPAPKRTWGLGMATTVALITRRVGGTKRKYSMVEGEGLYGRREGGSPRMRGVTTELCCTALVWGPSDCSNPPHPWTPTF